VPAATRKRGVRGTAFIHKGYGTYGSPWAPSGGRPGGEICNVSQRPAGNWFPPANHVLGWL